MRAKVRVMFRVRVRSFYQCNVGRRADLFSTWVDDTLRARIPSDFSQSVLCLFRAYIQLRFKHAILGIYQQSGYMSILGYF